MIVYDVKKLQWKFYKNQIRLRGLNACFSVFGTAKKAFLGPFRHQKQLNYDILHLTVEQTCLMIKKWCELWVTGDEEESETRNHLPNAKKKNFRHFHHNSGFYLFFWADKNIKQGLKFFLEIINNPKNNFWVMIDPSSTYFGIAHM